MMSCWLLTNANYLLHLAVDHPRCELVIFTNYSQRAIAHSITDMMIGLFVATLLAPSVFALRTRGHSGPVPENDAQALLTDSQAPEPHSHGRFVNERTSLTLFYQNNLNASDYESHIGAILLDPMGQHDIRDACEEIGETMVSISATTKYNKDFYHLFSYLFYSGGQTKELKRARFYTKNGILAVTEGDNHFDCDPFPSRDVQLPVLCTHTSDGTTVNRQYNKARQLLRVKSVDNTYIGSRDHRSFRFLGIPYAEPPTRFSYAKPYSGKSRTIRATKYGPRCAQEDGGSENCLSLNIYTPYIPKRNSTLGLRPVLFWFHGGDFTTGTGSASVTDGGNLASREDIVVVTFNYRVSTLGFLAVPDTDLRGNYGIADQVLALEWTIQNVAQFGGDPDRITIIGEAAGATSVKALLGSKPAAGKFQGAIAMSDLGSGAEGATSYKSYSTISESYEAVGQNIFAEASCDTGTVEEQISCLREIPASTLVNLPTVARHIVQDGKYVDRAELNLFDKTAGTANVPVIFGNTANEGASFIRFPSPNIESILEGTIESLGISTKAAQRILDSKLFPSPNTGNVTLDAFALAQQIATNTLVRCPNQASLLLGVSSGVLQSSYYYQMQRTMNGHDPDNHSLGKPSPTPEYPHGDPDLPYFRLHASDLPFIFGNLDTIRDPLDLYSAQLISSYFAEFVRSGQPNPDIGFLEARGHQVTLDVVNAFDRWEPIYGKRGPIQILDFPSQQGTFLDLEQCAFLGVPVVEYSP
ncbi:Alpha/Beta hydrolase protein [Aspergillus crustosus]